MSRRGGLDPAALGGRRAARERALALLYESESKAQPVPDVLAALDVAPEPYAAELVEGVERHRDEIDATITAAAVGWRLERMPAVDRALLRLAVFELLHERDVPVAAALNEAVELAKDYSTESSGRFVNGVLAAIAAEARAGEAVGTVSGDVDPPA